MHRRRFVGGLGLAIGLWPLGGMAATMFADKKQEWVEEAGALVDAADSGTAKARAFQREVRASRESLRDLVRDSDPESRGGYQNMILMVALLDAAAACHRGGYIVCPPDLMRQMRELMVRLRAQVGFTG